MPLIKYEDEILESFKSLGFKPRDGQVSAVSEILIAFIDNKMKNVVLCAPTGTGKSLIGAVTAETLSLIKRPGQTNKSSISLTATNVLAAQYQDTFDATDDYLMLKGAGNYPCSAMSEGTTYETAESCAHFTMVQSASVFQDVLDAHCRNCDFINAKKRRNSVRHLTTNYSYYFIDRMYTGKFEERALVIWDEAHLINDLFSNHNSIYFSEIILQKILKNIADTLPVVKVEISKLIKAIQRDCIAGAINESNYMTYLKSLSQVYMYVIEEAEKEKEKHLKKKQFGKASVLNRFSKAYEGRNCKIADLIKYDYPHVFEYKSEGQEVSVKPIFIGKMFDLLQCAEHNLLMSATISRNFAERTLQLDKEKTHFIKLAPSFPKENKQFVFYKCKPLNYSSLKNPEIIDALKSNIKEIVEHHVAKGDRGIILTPSFKLTQEIVEQLKKISGYKLFDHRQGEKLVDVMSAFKTFKGTSILISPSMFEGIDLPENLSRFQILVKAPFPSLGDKRMKHILDYYPDLYEEAAIMKCVQGAGRSVRSKDDFAVTYALDTNLKRIWSSASNIWKDEFNTRFTQFL